MRHRAIEAALNGADRTRSLVRPRRPRAFVYTDSRGFNFHTRLGKSGFGSYPSKLGRHYAVTQQVCPERHTTIVDFLVALDHAGGAERFDAVVMHCGIVDFSPRPVGNIARIRGDKAGQPDFDELFASNEGYHAAPFDVEYKGEPTITLYSPEYLVARIVPRLQRIPKLVWVNSNRFVPGWDGNYDKGRPANIDEVVSGFDAKLAPHLPHVVDLKGWSHDEIQRFTFDNIHFTPEGFDEVARRVDAELARALA